MYAYSLPSSVSGSVRPHGNHLGTFPLVVSDILSAIGLFGKSCYMQFAHCRIELNSKYPGASYVVLYSLYNSTVCVVTFTVLGTRGDRERTSVVSCPDYFSPSGKIVW